MSELFSSDTVENRERLTKGVRKSEERDRERNGKNGTKIGEGKRQ